MPARLLHIFRNNPLGRETLLQSIYFCKAVGANPVIYIPNDTKLWLDLGNKTIPVALSASYLTSPETACEHATQLLEQNGIPITFFQTGNDHEPMIHNAPSVCEFMTCPRNIGDLSSKIGLGHLGRKVRRIVKFAPFPILITSLAFKEWHNIAVFFGGSANALKALKLGFRLSRASGMPIDVFTQLEKEPLQHYEKYIHDKNLTKEMGRRVNEWHVFDQGRFEENLYHVPHDALVVMGARDGSPVKGLVFGSKMEKIHTWLPNNLLIAGPNYKEPNTSIPSWFPSLG